MSSKDDTDWEAVLAETPWDSDIRETLQEARMVGKEAILLANVMKQPMEQLMQLCCERFDVIVRLGLMLRKERQEVRKLRDEKATLEHSLAMTSLTNTDDSSSAWSRPAAAAAASAAGLSAPPTVAPFPITGLLLEKSGPFESFSDALTSKSFYEWCCASLNNENLEFYFSVELYRTLPPQARALKAAEMLRHFVREGATSQINIDHSVRSDLEAALPQSLLELVEKITADAKSKAAGGESSTSVSASGGGGGDESVAASGKKKTKTKSKSSSTPADDAASLNVASDIFDVAQARVYELMERDLWTRFRVDQATSSPRNNKAKTKKPAAAAATGMNASASAVGTSTPSTPSSSSGLSSSGTPSTGAKPLSPRRKAGNTVSSVAATMQAPAMVTQIKRVNGKIVVFRKGE